MTRYISVISPWKFKQTAPVMPLDPKVGEKIYSELSLRLSDGFKFAFHSICEAYENQDTEMLEQCLEPGLFSHVLNNFNTLDSQGYRFKRLSTDDPKIHLRNLQMSVGVNIDRSLNLSKSDYLMIKSLEELKSQIGLDFIKKNMEEVMKFDENILKSCMKFICFYVLPRAPANLVLSLDVVYESEAPLTLAVDGKDQIYKERVNEYHTFRFESEVIRFGTQNEMTPAKFSSAFQFAKDQEGKMYSNPWTVTDIDSVLLGNPYVK